MKIKGSYMNFNLSSGGALYSFWISDHHIPEDQEFEYIGKQREGKTNADVHEVQFSNCIMTKVPKGLTKFFPNLKMLNIYNSKELKKITKNDLVEYKNLKNFNCVGNEIEYLPGDLFEDFDHLRSIDFSNNKLTLIDPSILNGIIMLNLVNFSGNSKYDKCYSIFEYNRGKIVTLDEIRLYLHEKFYSRPSQQLRPEKLNSYEQYQIKSSLTDDLKSFLTDDTFKDFCIQIDDRKFPVHKFLLAARSPTLAEILKNNPEVENLNLVDISVEIFEIILKFLHTDELPGDDGTNFLHLFAAAGKLKIEDLMNYAAFKLMNQIDDENALDILKISNKYGHEELRQEAFKEIKEKYQKVNFKDEWATDTVKLEKAIEIIKQREEADRKMNEEFKKLMN